jgi:glucoamylase
VRYGIFAANDPLIVASVKVIDHVLKFDSQYGPCWRRYNHDGYGQDENGGPFITWGVGRPWPLLTGERAHYELAAGRDVKSYIKTIESFASPNGPIPEQIWDGDDLPEAFLFKAKPTGSAMPLAWAHAEYLKLLRSVTDGRVFDLIPEVYERYAGGQSLCKLITIWRLNWQVPRMKPGHVLRIQADRRFKLHWSMDNWQTTSDTVSSGTALAIDYLDLPVAFDQKEPVRFTFFWIDSNQWEEHDYQVTIS